MTRVVFTQELERLQDEVLVLGSMTQKAIERAVDSLKARDVVAAQSILADDRYINEKRFAIEEQALTLLATQAPMATDLRRIAAIIHIVTDLERMADHAAGIAKITLLIADAPLLKPLVDIPRMAARAQGMLQRALDAFVARDAAAARALCAEDDEVDALYDQVYRELLTFMIQDPRTIERATRLLWVAHNLERIADRVTNICERVVFMVTGRMEEINSSNY